MIIFLYGPDTYRSRQKLNEIIEHYKKIHKSGLNLKSFSGENLDFQDFKDGVKSVSMFGEKKLIILKNIFSNKTFQENFLKNPKNFADSKDIILIYEEKKIERNNPLFIFLKKFAKFQEFKFLGGKDLKNWIKKEFANYGSKINSQAIQKLIDFVGNDLWQMANEIKKLATYKIEKSDKKRMIDEGDVELLVKPKIETDIFETIDAIASRNKKRAMRLLKGHLEKGDSPLYLLSMISFQFRNLLVIKDLIEKHQSPYLLTNLHPYIIKKSSDLSKKFKLPELKKIYQKIFEVDLAIKTGKIEPETALDLLITEI